MRTLALILAVALGAGCTKHNADARKKVKNPKVVFTTTHGEFVVRVFADKAPLSAKNFLSYVDRGFYNGTIFHRVMSTFMIQGGGFTKDLQKKPTDAPIKNEATNGLSNKRGTLAMARTSVVDSATSQFFINVVDNARLDHRSKQPMDYGYAVFGEVIAGMEVVDAIKAVAVCPGEDPGCGQLSLPRGMMNVPATPVEIIKAQRAK